jgi:hypothetical protein
MSNHVNINNALRKEIGDETYEGVKAFCGTGSDGFAPVSTPGFARISSTELVKRLLNDTLKILNHDEDSSSDLNISGKRRRYSF